MCLTFNLVKFLTINFFHLFKEVSHVMHQIGLIVQHLHKMGIAHRDLKPENLLLATKSDEHFLIKLCDFGFAKEANGGLLTPK